MSIQETDFQETSLEALEHMAIEVSGGVAGAIAKSEVEAQLDAAHKYRRSTKQFLNEAITLATYSKEIAASCMYAVPRGGKVIEGPSVRLAEICISAYGNLHVGARVIGAEEKEVVSQGVCWDLEKNNRVTIEKRRKITDKKGQRFNDDMINVTGNAAASIALRDAAFRIIPRTFVSIVYEAAKKVAVGQASTLAARRDEVFQALVKMGAMPDRILARIGKPSAADIDLADLQVLIGFHTAIHSGSEKVDDVFPPVTVENAPTKGKVDLNTIKPGTEGNRGHGNENLGAAAGTKAANPETKPQSDETKSAPEEKQSETKETPAPDPEAKCTEAQFAALDTAQTQHDVQPKQFIVFVKETLGYKMVSHLKQKDFDRALAFLNNGGKERE